MTTIPKPFKSKRLSFFLRDHLASALKLSVLLIFTLLMKTGFSQELPAAKDCTSKDLLLVGASLEVDNVCTPTPGLYPLFLSINNKTGSVRTSFALWGTLVIKNTEGQTLSSTQIFACAAGIPKSAISKLKSSYSVELKAGETYEINNLFLAWTTSNDNETCSVLQNNSKYIAPKCGTLSNIRIEAGLSANAITGLTTCASNGADVTVTPFGGIAPYKLSVDGVNFASVAAGGSHKFTAVPVGANQLTILDRNGVNGCSKVINFNVIAPQGVSANAGSNFTKSCTSNPNGKQIGETAVTGFTYSWLPTAGLSNASASNPTANPTVTTTYTLTKTNTASGCTGTSTVTVTVDKPAVSAEAGDAFAISCQDNLNGKAIGETSLTGFTYAWSSDNLTDANEGLSSKTVGNPTANPSVTTIYTLTKTHTLSGCEATDNVTVTISNTKPTFTVCMVQPTLCSKGSITFNPTGGSSFEYSIDGGSSWKSSPDFTDLGAASVTGLVVKNDLGCPSTALDCETVQVSCTPDNARKITDNKVATSPTTKIADPEVSSQYSIKAFPNPYSNKVSFSVHMPVAGYGSLELYNMQGQKVATIYRGRIPQGTSTYKYSTSSYSSGILTYVLRVGDKNITGKLMNVNK